MGVTLDDIKDLYQKLIVPFHTIERDMTLPLPDFRPDNDAEHSWSLTFMAISLAPEVDKNLDVGLVSIFAAVHDIVEVFAGDTSVWADEAFAKTKVPREAEAMKKIKKDFPKFPAVHKYITEYESKKSDEAKFVYALDKFINLLTITEAKGHYYRVKYKITKAEYEEQLKDHRAKAYVYPKVGEYYDELRRIFDANPDHFYIDSKSQ